MYMYVCVYVVCICIFVCVVMCMYACVNTHAHTPVCACDMHVWIFVGTRNHSRFEISFTGIDIFLFFHRMQCTCCLP